jgi:hypothetical protein
VALGGCAEARHVDLRSKFNLRRKSSRMRD